MTNDAKGRPMTKPKPIKVWCVVNANGAVLTHTVSSTKSEAASWESATFPLFRLVQLVEVAPKKKRRA